MPRRAWAYVLSILLLGAVLSGIALDGVAPTPAAWATFAVLVTLATLAQLFTAEAPNHVSFYASPVFLFAGTLLLPPVLIMPLVAIPHLVEWLKERWTRSGRFQAWYLQPFNIAMYSIAGLAAHAVYTSLVAPATPWVALPIVAVMAVATLSYVTLNHVLLGLALMLARGVSWRDSGMLDTESLLSDGVLVLLGSVVATLWQGNPWMILPALSPLILMYRALLIPQLKQEAQIDAKTGLYNARHFNTLFAAEMQRAQRFDRPLAVIMADLDLLRDINNTYGHLAGDTVLTGLGRIIRDTVREYDIAGRFGGEEFALVLPETEPGEAEALAERLRQAVEATRFDVATSATPLQVTMSLGIACFPMDATTPTALTHAADLAVYQAKASGRNRVVCAGDVPQGLAVGQVPRAPSPASTGTAPEPVRSLPAPPMDAAPGAWALPAEDVGAGAGVQGEEAATAATSRKATQRLLPWFVSAVVLAGAGATLLGLLWGARPSPAVAGLLVALAVVVELLQIDLYGRGTVSVSMSLAFAAALLTGVPGLALVSAGIALTHHARQGRRMRHLYRVAFNWGTHVLAGLAPTLLVGAGGIPVGGEAFVHLLLPTTIAALAYYAIETGLIATAVGLAEGTSPYATWRAQYRWLAGHYFVLCLMGLILGLAAATVGLLGALVFTLPVLMMHYVQKQYIARTKESMRELSRLNRELTRAALADHLTGLGNQRAFQQELQRTVALADHGAVIALARINLDEFKVINDQHGHGEGDRCLVNLALVLRGSVSADRVFRLGGDEFALLLPRTELPAAVTAMEQVREEARRRLGGTTVSIGVAAITAGDSDADTLNDRAAAALGEAKRRGRDGVVTFDAVKDSVTTTSSVQAQLVRRLLAERRINVAFQPIWDLAQGRILAFEALTRPAAEYGFAGPQEAFDIAERIGRAHDLDAVCREAILARAADLPRDALLFINLSPQTLDHGLLQGDALVRAVTAAGLAPGRVVLELTERSMARLAIVVREARRLQGLGFRLALDDTGAGNAGLEMLSQLPVDFIKIDRAVVGHALTDTAARAVLAGIVAIAQEMRTYVIAEGIETLPVLDLVRRIGTTPGATRGGVQGVQGYLLGRPAEVIPDAITVEPYSTLLRAA